MDCYYFCLCPSFQECIRLKLKFQNLFFIWSIIYRQLKRVSFVLKMTNVNVWKLAIYRPPLLMAWAELVKISIDVYANLLEATGEELLKKAVMPRYSMNNHMLTVKRDLFNKDWTQNFKYSVKDYFWGFRNKILFTSSICKDYKSEPLQCTGLKFWPAFKRLSIVESVCLWIPECYANPQNATFTSDHTPNSVYNYHLSMVPTLLIFFVFRSLHR